MKFIKVFIEWESIWRTATLQHCNTDAINGHTPRRTHVSPHNRHTHRRNYDIPIVVITITGVS